ncbi:MAG: response regulator [Gemmatimonadetes bacterium]|nr:response regulator [Gemmatimonadota bacterium]
MNALPRSQRVMFVDDEEGVRVSWNRYLSGRGFDVTTAEDGEQAITRLRDDPVDVVVSDLRMPGLDGLQLLAWLHESQPGTRFILFTGYGDEEVERKARELGAFEYLNKPISPETLSAVITAALQLQRIRVQRTPAPEPALPAEPELRESETAALEVEVAAGAERAAEPALAPSAGRRVRGILQIAGGLIAGPLLGLAFVIFLPVIGFVALFWVLGEAIRKRVGGESGATAEM